MRQIDGQLNLIDLMQDKTGYSIGEQYRSEGYTNAYDAMPDHPCKVDVIDHEGNRFQIECVESFGRMAFNVGHHGKGYDICWWKEIEKPKKCGSCIHMRRSVYGLMEYHGWACFGFGISRSQDPQQTACEMYEPKGDCSTCKHKVWLHWDGKGHQGCNYAGGGFCKYERRDDAL